VLKNGKFYLNGSGFGFLFIVEPSSFTDTDPDPVFTFSGIQYTVQNIENYDTYDADKTKPCKKLSKKIRFLNMCKLFR
jgi:hypothetical protein